MTTLFEFKLQSPDPRLKAWLDDYPEGLFDERLFHSIELADRYSLALVFALVDRLGTRCHLEQWCSAPELCRILGFVERFHGPMAWLLERMVAAGEAMGRQGDKGREYRCRGSACPAVDLQALRQIGLTVDPRNAATLDLLDAAAAAYPAVARGGCSGEEALLGMGGVGLWLGYFDNENPLYAVNNRVAAIAAVKRLAAKRGVRVLEIGAGAGSGTEALLEALAAGGLLERLERYRVTEPGPFFRRRCQRRLQARYRDLPLEFADLDMDLAWSDQGVEPGSFDLVLGVNVFHVAKDLGFSLSEACAALAPGGWLVAGECLRPFQHHGIYIEFVFQLLEAFGRVETNPDSRPDPGFLMPEHWRKGFMAQGFGHVEITPDHERIRDIYPRLLIGAVCGQKSS